MNEREKRINERFYAYKLEVDPDPVILVKQEFSTQQQADDFISSNIRAGDFWYIVHERNGIFKILKPTRVGGV